MTDEQLEEENKKKKRAEGASTMDYANMAKAMANSQSGEGSAMSSLGNAGMASGNPYAMAAGGAMKVIGAYADAKKKKEDEIRKSTVAGLGNIQKLIMGAPRA